jgi:ferrous iron transport protein B
VSTTDRLDAVLLHPVWGAVSFALVMALLFQSIFAWAEPLMDFIEDELRAAGQSLRGERAAGGPAA